MPQPSQLTCKCKHRTWQGPGFQTPALLSPSSLSSHPVIPHLPANHSLSGEHCLPLCPLWPWYFISCPCPDLQVTPWGPALGGSRPVMEVHHAASDLPASVPAAIVSTYCPSHSHCMCTPLCIRLGQGAGVQKGSYRQDRLRKQHSLCGWRQGAGRGSGSGKCPGHKSGAGWRRRRGGHQERRKVTGVSEGAPRMCSHQWRGSRSALAHPTDWPAFLSTACPQYFP